MSKIKPNIITPFNDKQRFKNLVQEVVNDIWIYTHRPDIIDLNGVIFTLTLTNKKFEFQEIQVDSLSEYVDIYLYGIKIPNNKYSVTDDGTNIIIQFNQQITLSPQDVITSDFSIKGKIVSR